MVSITLFSNLAFKAKHKLSYDHVNDITVPSNCLRIRKVIAIFCERWGGAVLGATYLSFLFLLHSRDTLCSAISISKQTHCFATPSALSVKFLSILCLFRDEAIMPSLIYMTIRFFVVATKML